MLLIVNLNLALDHLLWVERLQPTAVQRAVAVQTQAGGKGVNVARALKAFRLSGLVTGFLGGWRSQRIRASLQEEAIPFDGVDVGGTSRECLILFDRRKQKTTVINEQGPLIARRELEAWLALYDQRLPQADAVIISGSFPPGVPPQTVRRILRRAHAADKPTFLDTSGGALVQAIQAPPTLLKINQSETETLVGYPIQTPRDAQRAAAELLGRGLRLAVITLGSRGAVLATPEEQYFIRTVPGQGWNDVGCGDAMLASLVASHLCRLPPAEMARWAVATAVANLSRGFGRVTIRQIGRLRPQIRCRRLGRPGRDTY